MDALSTSASVDRIRRVNAAPVNGAVYRPRTEGLFGLLGLLGPAVADVVSALTSEWKRAQLDDGVFSRPDDLATLLLPGLEQTLLHQIGRTMTLELNVARLEGRLNGSTPQERYRSFLEHLETPAVALELLERYPALIWLGIETLDAWKRTSLEFGRRLAVDRTAIFDRFGIADDATVASLNGLAGDRHRGGRGVIVVEMSDASKFVYKPRSLAVDAAFQNLVGWLSARSDIPTVISAAVLPRDEYGWQAYVLASGCASVTEVEDHYRRQGANLALLYALGGRDIHHENVIACGEFPVMVDLEALFAGAILPDGTDATDHARRYLDHSVVATGLLPFPGTPNDAWGGLDISGLRFVGGGPTPYDVPRFVGVQTDTLVIAPGPMPLPHSNNLPMRDGNRETVSRYIGPLEEGFVQTYDAILTQRDDLLASDGPIAPFRTTEVRTVLRSTRLYGRLLWESLHPSLLADPGDREAFLDGAWSQISTLPQMRRCVSSESAALRVGDIPVFNHHPGTTKLTTGDGTEIEGFFSRSGLELAHDRIAGFGEADRARQIWLLRTALTDERTPFTPRDLDTHTDAPRPDVQRLLRAARKVAQEIADLVIESPYGVTWFGRTSVGGKKWVTAPLGSDLYEGLSGVALFLATLAAFDDDRRWRCLADGAVLSLLQQIDNNPSRTIGVFNGWGSVIYALTHLAHLLNRPDLRHRARHIHALLPPLIDADKNHDVIAGAAGCILGLLADTGADSGDGDLDLARICGERLLHCAQHHDAGIAWSSSISPGRGLIGMSHGTAGIALALSRLGVAAGEERFCEAARQAIAYERAALASASAADMPLDDNHIDQVSSGPPSSWCHGWAGIGLSRIGLFGDDPDGALVADLERCVNAIRRGGIGSNASLCHGDMGKLDLALTAAERIDGSVWSGWESAALEALLTDVDTGRATLGHPKGTRSVGLMNGLSGAGYGLLRAAFPDRVPSVLLIEPVAAGPRPGGDVGGST